jgi:hypothetical protein
LLQNAAQFPDFLQLGTVSNKSAVFYLVEIFTSIPRLVAVLDYNNVQAFLKTFLICAHFRVTTVLPKTKNPFFTERV